MILLRLLSLSVSIITARCALEDLNYQNQAYITPYGDGTITVFRNGGNTTSPHFVYTIHLPLNPGDCLYNHLGRKLSCGGLPSAEESHIGESSRWYIVPKDLYFFWPPYYIGHTISPYNMDLTLTTVSVRPAVFLVDGLTTPDQTQQFIDKALSLGLFQSQVYSVKSSNQSGNTNGTNYGRDSKQAWVHPTPDLPYAMKFREDVVKLTQVQPKGDNYEQIQVARYQYDGHYHAHYDWYDPVQFRNSRDDLARGLNRMITVLVYAKAAIRGGVTNFPVAHRNPSRKLGKWPSNIWSKCDEGITVRPQTAQAVMFYNMYPKDHHRGDGDLLSLHGGCEVLEGEKWIMNQWIHNMDSNYAAKEPYRDDVLEAFKWTSIKENGTKTYINTETNTTQSYQPKVLQQPYDRV